MDTLITDFLRLLSPHFLIKPAGKALEWLLYRYHVADYNLDELVACALPYHETAQFVRVCKLVQHSQQAASSTSMWKFLVQCGKLELPLDRASLVHQLYKQPAVLKFILGMVRAAIDEVTVAVPLAGFFAATMMAYLDKAGAAVNDNTIIALMPTLLSCLRAKEFADVQVCSNVFLCLPHAH